METSRRRTLQSLATLLGTVAVAGCREQSAETSTASADSTDSTTSAGTPSADTASDTDSQTATPTATATPSASSASERLAAHLDEVPNYDGTVRDWRGQSTVRVEVGVELGYGPFGFGPPAIRIDPGTTVQWAWTGEGGQHNVVAKDGTFDSGDAITSSGVEFEYTFESAGVYEYYCEPHRTSQMKGGIVVGAVADTAQDSEAE